MEFDLQDNLKKLSIGAGVATTSQTRRRSPFAFKTQYSIRQTSPSPQRSRFVCRCSALEIINNHRFERKINIESDNYDVTKRCLNVKFGRSRSCKPCVHMVTEEMTSSTEMTSSPINFYSNNSYSVTSLVPLVNQLEIEESDWPLKGLNLPAAFWYLKQLRASNLQGSLGRRATTSTSTQVAMPTSSSGCSFEARRMQQIYADHPIDSTTPSELAAYLDEMLHLPKKMSTMAENMYT